MSVPDDVASLNNALNTAAVEQDIPCRRCGYNLRGLPLTSRCPECGTMVGVSVRGDLLRFSDPQFVATLHQGVRLMLWAILVIVIGAIAAAVTTALRRASGLSFGVQLLPLAGSLLNVIGAWLLTTPDPSGIGEDQYGTARKLIRFSLAMSLLNDIISFDRNMALPPAVNLVLQIISGLSALAGLIGAFAQLQYLEKLATRIPSDALSNRSRVIKWGLGISYGVVVVFGLLALVFAQSGASPPAAIVGGCIAGLAGLAAIVFGIMYLFLLISFSNALGEQTALARANWSPNQPPSLA